MRLSISRCRWALASICTSALLGALLATSAEVFAAQKDGEPVPLRAGLAAMELEVAKTPVVYLWLDVGRSSVEVRMRGKAMGEIAAAEIRPLGFRPASGGEPPALELPTRFIVEDPPDSTHRKLIAPEQLRPYDKEHVSSRKPEELDPERPSAYEVGLSDGWRLQVAQEPADLGFWSRWRAAFDDGLDRVLGRPRPRPPVLLLVLAEADARQMLHLFRKGTQIFLVDSQTEG